MKVKDKWTNADYEEMGWHDSVLYTISFPQGNQKLVLDMDYIFEFILNENNNLYSFLISPCTLTFFNVINLKINLDFENFNNIEIKDITRINPIKKDGFITDWEYIIATDMGTLSFNSTGFEQIVREEPIISDSYSLGR